MERSSSLLAALTAAACLLRVSKAGLDLPISLILHGALALSLFADAVMARRSGRLWARLPQPRDTAVVVAASALWLLREDPTDLISAALIGLGLTRAALAWTLRATTAVLAVHALVFQLTRPETAVTALQRFQGWTGDPNDAALVALLAAIPALLALARPSERPSGLAWLDLLHALLTGGVIAASQSRFAMVAFVLMAATAAAPLLRTRSRLGLVMVALLAGVILIAPDRFWFRLFGLMEGRDLGMRPYLWEVGLAAFRESPWTGVGVGRFPELARGLAPHSLLLACLAEGGLLHTTALVALIVTVVRSAMADRERLSGAAALALALVAPLDSRVFAIALVAPLFSLPEPEPAPGEQG